MKFKFSILLFITTFLNLNAQKKATNSLEFPTEIIKCDSIYPQKNYRIVIKKFEESVSYEDKVYNSIFMFQKKVNGQYKTLYRDSLQCHFHQVKFEDFSGDGTKDILIENISDVRSNETFYLFVIDLKNDKLTKIEGFNKIKNPRYIKKYDLIDNLVMSGQDWSSFYYIKNQKVINFEEKGFIISWTKDENDENADKEYDKLLKKVLIERKKIKK